MFLSIGWQKWLCAVAGIGVLVYLFSGSDGGTYRAPEVSDRPQEPIAEFNRAKYAERLKSINEGELVLKVEKGLSDHEVILQTGPRWRALDEAARLHAARRLWDVWSKLHPPDQRYRTRLVVVDENGAKVGGSRLLDSSKIWVRKNKRRRGQGQVRDASPNPE